MKKNRNPKPPKQGSGAVTALLVVILLILMGLTGLMIYLCTTVVHQNPAPQAQMHQSQEQPAEQQTIPPEPAETEPPETTMPDPEHVVSTATVAVTGDLLMHAPLYQGNYSAECYNGGEYDFSSIFKYAKEYTENYDYMIANLETTLYGTGKPYLGYPAFNTPDAIVDGVKDAGFDMLLTVNNHSNDTGFNGITRTLEVVRDRGLQTLGTNLTEEEDKYYIADVNGIKIGMLCYSYDDSKNPNIKSLNGNQVASEGTNLVCTFPLFQESKDRGVFYEDVKNQIAEMKEKGADAIVIYLHWGIEYRLDPTEDQKDMAQKLCDLGVDLIVGGHPHVIEPVELLTSTTDPQHKTVCLYSMGNAVSNQRLGNLSTVPTAHTEDGMFFTYTFEKYSDDTVYLSGVEVVPTWVNMYNNAERRREYNILPLEDSRREEWMEMFDLTDTSLQKASDSYDRTMKIVGDGVAASNAYLTQQKEARDANYLAMVQPGYAAPTEVPETVFQETEALETTESAA